MTHGPSRLAWASLSSWLRRIARAHRDPRRVAHAVVWGACVSLLPVPFVGMAIALALAPRLHLNAVATYGGTALINPITGPLCYFAELWAGAYVLGQPLPSWREVSAWTAAQWWTQLQEAWIAMCVGALVMACALGPLLWVATWLVARQLGASATSPARSHDRALTVPQAPKSDA